MVINTSETKFVSQSTYQKAEKYKKQFSYRPVYQLKTIGDNEKTEDNAGVSKDSQGNTVITSNSNQKDFLSSLNYAKGKNGTVSEVGTTQDTDGSMLSKLRMSTMMYLLEQLLFGRYTTANSIQQYSSNTTEFTYMDAAIEVTESTTIQSYEYQATSFTGEGTVITADGRQLSFNYSFEMSESFYAKYQETTKYMQQPAFIDPLVVNLDSNPASIADQKFFFDLDCDGQEEEISRLGANSGYLALDKNGDGIINDGSELFGTKSGDGFYDLSQYDEDNNGWIDEADSIFEKLLIWTTDEHGKSELYKLKDKDIGAICLQKVQTQFTSYDNERNAQARIRSTGIYLKESTGQAQSIQHLDMAT